VTQTRFISLPALRPSRPKPAHDSPIWRGFLAALSAQSGGVVVKLQNFLAAAVFLNDAHAKLLLKVVRVAGSNAMVTDLQTKVEKYETKVAQCDESGRQARDARERDFYEVLSRYYGSLATDFRRIIEKRQAA
jgi:uncharacterized protein YlxW (UPF0749 family)